MVELEAATLENDYAERRPHQLSCERDAGRAGAHDADVGFECRGVDGARVMKRHLTDPGRAATTFRADAGESPDPAARTRSA